jgi:2-polyprenyl-6-methoxyphenol hydroxylase-like FAD-dependent oxidoreductase
MVNNITMDMVRNIFCEMGLIPFDSYNNVTLAGLWKHPFQGKHVERQTIVRWSATRGFLLYHPEKYGKNISFFVSCDPNQGEYINPLEDEHWHRHLIEWFAGAKRKVYELAAEMHNDEINKSLEVLEG